MIVTQEELITSFFIFSHLKYSPEIKRRHPGAKKWSKRNLLQIWLLYVMDVSDKSIFIMYTLKNANTEYFVAHCSRLLDGLLFLFINTCVMLLQKNDVLGLFLNFAALMWDLVSVPWFWIASLYYICFYDVLKTICICLQVFTNNRQYCIASLLRRVLDTIAYGFSARCCRYEVCC